MLLPGAHIEQGGSLDKAGTPIGVVEGIVSIDEYDVEIRGFANHAGTTPMPERRNALLAAAKLIGAVQAVVTREPGRQVGTVGRMASDPVTSADEGRYLVEIINTFHPGRGSFVELPGMGHDFARYSSEAEFIRRRQESKAHPFDDEVLVVLTKWIEARSHT